jgi:tetratricopeptide (TPR) repeat protein
MARPLKIFISSPGDVADERRRAALVISLLRREFARFFDISAVLWEYEPMLSSGHFQDIISPPSTADIVVLILWSRLGTPLPARTAVREYKSLTGEVPVTGTQWEFEEALEARKRQNGVPDLLVYRKFADGIAKFSRAEELEGIRQQWEALQAFWRRHFEDEEGRFKAAFNRFSTLDEFQSQLEHHLRDLLRRRLPPQPLRMAGRKTGDRIEWWSGSPYRGLQAFDMEHAAVFFGRERAEREISELLIRHAADGKAFMLVVGASGSGKSSLVRAGVLPDLIAPGVVSAVSTWRHVVVQPTDLAADPFVGLARALIRPTGLPELASLGYLEADLAAQFRSDPTLATVPLRVALQRAAAEDRNAPPGVIRQARLVLVIDQFEVLFTSAEFSGDVRTKLDRLLARLAESGLVWVIATLRSDFYHRLVEMPEINALAAGLGQYLLSPPSAAEMEQIITQPAEVAGFSFEVSEDTGISLGASIRESAARDPASLPLLSFVLDELYRRDISEHGDLLTYASYRALGGLEGAIAQRAEALVEDLAPDLKSALPELLLALVEIDELKGTVTARTVARSALTDPKQRELADQLVVARLAIADDTGSGVTLRLAHEALLSHWPRIENLITEHRAFLIVRRRLQADGATWRGQGRLADYLLPPGRRLAEAQELLISRRSQLDPEIIAYAEASVDAEKERVAAAQRAKEAALRRELKRSRQFAAVVSVLLVLAIVAGFYAWQQRQNASAALLQAQANYQIALDQAAGSVTLLTDSYGEGGISTKLMQQLVAKAQKTINSLPGETDDVTAARASLLDVLSLAQFTLGNVADAEKFANDGLKLANALRAKEPTNARWKRLEAAAHGRLSDVLFWKGDSVVAVQEANLARELSDRLVAEAPQDEELQFNLIDQLRRLGEGLEDQGELEQARANYRKWIDIATAHLKASPPDPKWRSSLAFAHREIGDTLTTERRHTEAGIEYGVSVQISADLLSRFPQNTAYLYTLASARLRVGDALYGQGDFEGARLEYEAAKELTVKLLKSEPNNFRSRELLQAAYQRVGDVYLAQKKYDLASKEFRAYANLAVETQTGIPNNPNALYDVTNAYQKIGDVLREEGKLEDALGAYEDSLKVAIDMNNASFWNGAWKKMLAMDYQRIAMVYRLRGDRGSAIAHFRRCAEIPINNFVWSPRTLWPADVVGFCRKALSELQAPTEQ